MMSKPDHLRKAIIDQMRKQELSAYMVAKYAGIAPNTMRRYELGESNLRSDYLAKVCTVLKLKLVAF